MVMGFISCTESTFGWVLELGGTPCRSTIPAGTSESIDRVALAKTMPLVSENGNCVGQLDFKPPMTITLETHRRRGMILKGTELVRMARI